ncbi:MAG TPA: 5-formyltetrahydrofolate cyclo-ligase [bacterium]|nr:5-formyltetrahydrofolate cyclo-ligase [bacterium]
MCALESIQESKEDLRRRMKGLRESLKAHETLARSLEVGRRLFESSLLDRLTSVALYASVRGEVSTEWIFGQLQKRGCRTFFPRVTGERIEFVPVPDWGRLVPDRWEIPAPLEGESVSLEEVEAVLVPGVAFDEQGNRLGFGKGYYDRCLSGFQGRKIGLAYDFQVVPEIPRMETDLVCHWIVTETRTIRGIAKEEPSWNHKPL